MRKYNIDVASEATKAGVDDILYDYIRRPDGPLSTMVFPGLRGGAQRSIVSFLADARTALDPSGAFLGASVFGIAAFHPDEVAQDVARMARNVNYIAPLLYPSGWAPDSFGIPDPAQEPAKITKKSLDRFQLLMKGSGARLVPWLQDFSLNGVNYGPRPGEGPAERRPGRRGERVDLLEPERRVLDRGVPEGLITRAARGGSRRRALSGARGPRPGGS